MIKVEADLRACFPLSPRILPALSCVTNPFLQDRIVYLGAVERLGDVQVLVRLVRSLEAAGRRVRYRDSLVAYDKVETLIDICPYGSV